MKNTAASEKSVKPFRLVKYFTFTSLIVIFVGTVVLSVLNTHWARTMQRKKSEDYASVLVENLNRQVFVQFLIPVFIKFGKIQLRDKEQFERMDKVVRTTLHSFKVDMVNIYDMGNIISYSFDRSLIGQENVGGAGYQNALRGNATSKLVQRGNFWEIQLGIPKESKIITFAPLRAERPLSILAGPVLGVVEIVQDLSAEYHAIFRFQIRVISTYAVVMGVLFLVLLFVVKRGESISEKRALERLRLKEQLSRAERLSSLGEMAAGISHEIRNPLGIIRSSAELMKKKMAAVDSSNMIPNVIVEETNRLNDIITDFINFAKPKKPDLIYGRVEDVLEA
ncbi:histidine kinase dimerization/phospho-acceptor domain-containing protein, partial [Thermodesulfobacteriota bacterium]